jgi:hypothetical protein
MRNITHQRYGTSRQITAMLTNGENVEQPLGGMLVRPVTRIHHTAIQMLRQLEWSTRGGMTDHDRVHIHRL